jgi:uncharacterized protein (TIGR02453 family)
MPQTFTPASLKFLRSLARHNDREWFTPRKAIYEAELKEPMLALIEEVNAAMAGFGATSLSATSLSATSKAGAVKSQPIGFAPEHVRPPHKTMMRIYRDTRFPNDKRPYKSQASAWWARRGMEKTSGGGYYMHVHPKEVVIAVGAFMPEREQLLAIRRWMADNHAAYRAMLNKLMKPRNASAGNGSAGSGSADRSARTSSPFAIPFSAIDAEALKRMPKGFSADHPADDLLRAKNWGVRVALPAEAALEPGFKREVIARFRAATPLVDALNSAITGALPGVSENAVRPAANEEERKPRRPLF